MKTVDMRLWKIFETCKFDKKWDETMVGDETGKIMAMKK